jgi:hypothetical protein
MMGPSMQSGGGLPYAEAGPTALGTVSASVGSITTVGTKNYWVTKIGRKVTLNFSITITTNGTGAGVLSAAGLPYPSINSSGYQAIGSARSSVSGKQIQVILAANSSTMSLVNYDNTYPAADGAVITGTITYFTT